jgi:hypothetical protein
MGRKLLAGCVAALALVAGSTVALAQVGTEINYQGQLKEFGSSTNAPVDLEFRLFTAASGGSQVGSTVSATLTPVDGLFSQALDFGVDPYTQDSAVYLEVSVRAAGGGSFSVLPRQKLTAAPFSAATRGLNVNADGRVGVLASPFFTNDVSLTLGSAGGGFPSSNLLFAPGTGFNWSAAAFAQDGAFGGFTLSRSGLDFPLVIDGQTSNFLVNQSSAGKVGIGTGAPQARLDVAGTSRFGGRVTVTGSAPIGEAGSGLWINGNDNGPLFPAGTSELGIRIFNNSLAPGQSTIQAWDYSTDSGRDLVINDAGGKVGIGTSTPTKTLEVGGDSKFNGQMGVLANSTPGFSMNLGSVGGSSPSIKWDSTTGLDWDMVAFDGTAGTYGDFAISRSGTDFPFIISGSTGGVGINTNAAAGVKLHVRQGTNNNGVVRIDSGLSAAQYSIVSFSDRGNAIWSAGLRPDGMFGIDRDGINTMLQIDQAGRIGMGGAVPTAGRALNMQGGAFCTGSVWTNACDKNLKEDFVAVNEIEILEKVADLPITTWRYKGDDKVHVGPTAQDFRAAFGLGENDKSIGTVDADGVSLAAIKGLNTKLEAKETEIADLKTRLEKIEALLNAQTSGGAK